MYSFSGNCAASVPNPIYVFLFWELHGLSPNIHIHLSVCDIPRINPHISCSRIGRLILEIYINLSYINECRNWETNHYNSVLEITVLFLGIHKWETTFILDTHRSFMCSVGLNLCTSINRRYNGRQKDAHAQTTQFSLHF